LRLRLDQIEHWITPDIHESVSPEQCFDLFAWAATEKRELIADRRIFGACAGICSLVDRQCRRIELAVDDDEPPARSKYPNPFVDRRLGVGQGPQQMTADDEIEGAGREPQLLGIALLEAHWIVTFGCFAPRLSKHRRRKVDPHDPMAASYQFEAEESSAATDIEDIERAPLRHREVKDTVPGGALSRGTDAVPEIFVEMRRPTIPVRGDLLFYDIGLNDAHAPHSSL
jgi:hypothetical protein